MPETFVPANVANKTEFISFIKDDKGKITGIIARDNLTKK